MLPTVRDSFQLLQDKTKNTTGKGTEQTNSIILLHARATMCVINLIIVFNVVNCTRLASNTKNN